MALYNNPYQYSFGVPGQMNQFQQQPVQMPAQPVQQPQQNNNGILWVSGEVGAKSYLVAPGTSVLLMDSESEKFYIKSTDVSGMPQPLRTFEYHAINIILKEVQVLLVDVLEAIMQKKQGLVMENLRGNFIKSGVP